MSDRLGLGVMLQMLGGNEKTVKAVKTSLGKEVFALAVVKRDDNEDYYEDRLMFSFTDGTGLLLWDGGQSCCELRYLHTDDKVGDFVGAELMKIELRDGPTTEDEYGEPHDVQFVLVTTSLGVFTLETHNEHNGYYGGFWIEAELI